MKTEAHHTKQVYDQFGKIYHEKRLNPKKSFWNDCIENPAMELILKKAVPGKSVLDLGCGSGLLTKKIARWGGEVSGIDFSKTLIEIAEKENPALNFIVSDARKTPFEDSSFDIVASSLVIHYVKDVNKIFKEVSRILKSGGSFVFSFHHPFNEILDLKDNKVKNKYSLRNYFDSFKYEWEMEKMKMISYHHTFEEIIWSLGKNGLFIKKLKEPKPNTQTRMIDEKSFLFTSQIPSFCLIHSVKLKK